jgi:hypothetical protein
MLQIKEESVTDKWSRIEVLKKKDKGHVILPSLYLRIILIKYKL